MRILTTTLLAFLVTLFWGCSQGSVAGGAGGAGEVGNPIVVCFVSTPDGEPISGASVYILEENFNPRKRTATALISNSAGKAEQVVSDSLKYVITVTSSEPNLSGYLETVKSGDTVHITLKPSASFRLKLREPSSDEFILGTPFVSTSSSTSTVVFPQLPYGMAPQVYRSTDDIDLLIHSEEVPLNEGEDRFVDLNFTWKLFNGPSISDQNEDEFFHSIVTDAEENIWSLALSGPEKVVCYTDNQWVTYFNTDFGLPPQAEFKALEIDKNGIVWCASTHGLAYIDGSRFGMIPTAESGLSSNQVTSIGLAGDGGSIWFGSDSSIAQFDGVNWTSFTNKNSEMPSSVVTGITVNSNGVLLATLSDSGFVTIENGTLDYHDDSEIQQGCIATSDGSGRFWMITTESAYIYDNGDLEDYFPQKELFKNEKLSQITLNPATKDIWVSGQTGLWCFHDDQWKKFDRTNSGLGNDGVFDITFTTIDGINTGIAGTDDGLVLFYQ